MGRSGYVLAVLTLAATAFLASCGTSPSAPVADIWGDQIPWYIRYSADRYAQEHLGAEFFRAYYTWDEERSRYDPPDEWCLEHPENCHWALLEPRYTMVYDFEIPEIPFARGSMWFSLHKWGAVMEDDPPMSYGLPDCVRNPIECQFPIDDADARQIAEDDGLDPGIQDWRVGFTWYGGDFQTYTWGVKNYLAPDHGEGITIDANTGEILGRYHWFITVDGLMHRLHPN